MKILLDMNLSPDWATVLVKAGHDAVHWSTIGDPGASDRVIVV
jgi:predicted nuclease of predicted toxin-antitoxin system